MSPGITYIKEFTLNIKVIELPMFKNNNKKTHNKENKW